MHFEGCFKGALKRVHATAMHLMNIGEPLYRIPPNKSRRAPSWGDGVAGSNPVASTIIIQGLCNQSITPVWLNGL